MTSDEFLKEVHNHSAHIRYCENVLIAVEPKKFFKDFPEIDRFITGSRLEITTVVPHVCNCKHCKMETEEKTMMIERDQLPFYTQRLEERDRVLWYAIPVGKTIPIDEPAKVE